MRTSRRAVLFVGLGSLLLGISGPTVAVASTGPSVPTVTQGVLTVAADNDMPYDGFTTSGQLTGVQGDIAKEVAQKLGLKLKVVTENFASELAAIQTGRVDTMADAPVYTPQRAKLFQLSSALYYIPSEIGQRKNENFTTVQSLYGHTVGTLSGYSQNPTLIKLYGASNVKIYQTLDAVVQDILNGRLDAEVGLGSPSIAWIIKQHPTWDLKYVIMKPSSLYPDSEVDTHAVFPVNIKDVTLVKAINRVIAQMKANGDLKRILGKFDMNSPSYLSGKPPTS